MIAHNSYATMLTQHLVTKTSVCWHDKKQDLGKQLQSEQKVKLCLYNLDFVKKGIGVLLLIYQFLAQNHEKYSCHSSDGMLRCVNEVGEI